ncbi:MAG: ABC transporter permease [Anaerolineae bacterium]
MRRSWLPVAVFAVIVVVWEVLAQMDQSRVQVIPAPSDILAAMIRTRETLLTRHIPETLLVTLIGMGIAIVTGLIIAALLDFSPALRQAIYPLLVISQTIPLIALATVLLLVFDFDLRPKVAVVVLFCFFPITVSTLDGLAATDPDVVALLRAMGASRWQVWRMARLPAALPAFFSGLRIAATYSVTGAITGEYVASQYGLGQYLRQAYSSGRIDQAFAGIVIVAILSIALVLIVSLIERLALPWFFTQSRQASWNEPGIY